MVDPLLAALDYLHEQWGEPCASAFSCALQEALEYEGDTTKIMRIEVGNHGIRVETERDYYTLRLTQQVNGQ